MSGSLFSFYRVLLKFYSTYEDEGNIKIHKFQERVLDIFYCIGFCCWIQSNNDDDNKYCIFCCTRINEDDYDDDDK